MIFTRNRIRLLWVYGSKEMLLRHCVIMTMKRDNGLMPTLIQKVRRHVLLIIG